MFEFRELNTPNHFSQCHEIQEKAFALNAEERISPLILNLLNREWPPIGIVLGAFSRERGRENLIGMAFATATMEKRSLYGMMVAVLPEYQNYGVGRQLIIEIRKKAILKNIQRFYGVLEPLEANLAHLYFNRLGYIGEKYEESVFHPSQEETRLPFAQDKILFCWYVQSRRIEILMKNQHLPFQPFLKRPRIPIALPDSRPDCPKIRIEIPGNFSQLDRSDPEAAKAWRQRTRNLFREYLNIRHYRITGYLRPADTPDNKSFYILQKRKHPC